MMDCKEVMRGSSSFTITPETYATAITSLLSCVEKGGVLYIALGKSPIAIKRTIPGPILGKLRMVFISPGLTKVEGVEIVEMQSQGDLTELSLLLTKTVNTMNPSIVVFDGLASLTFYYPMETLVRFVKFTIEKLALTRTASVFLTQDDDFLKKTGMLYEMNLEA